MPGNVSSGMVGLAVLYGLTLALFGRSSGLPEVGVAAAMIPGLIWLSLHDLDHLEIPDRAVLWLLGLSLVYLAVVARPLLVSHAVTGGLVLVILWGLGAWVFHRVGQEGLGIGDAKLFGVGAVLLGPWKLPELLLLSSLGGIVAWGLWRLRNAPAQAKGVPFGPFIAYAIFVLHLTDPLFL